MREREGARSDVEERKKKKKKLASFHFFCLWALASPPPHSLCFRAFPLFSCFPVFFLA